MKIKKMLISTKPWRGAGDWMVLMLRMGFGIIMMAHGWSKIQRFDELSEKFMSFMGLGSTVSLSLAIFAEVICSALLMIGLFTRLATIPLIITTITIMSVHNWDIIWNMDNEIILALLVAYFAILIHGPGKHSMDNLLSK